MPSLDRLETTLEEIRDAGLYKVERIITTPQGADIRVTGGREVVPPELDRVTTWKDPVVFGLYHAVFYAADGAALYVRDVAGLTALAARDRRISRIEPPSGYENTAFTGAKETRRAASAGNEVSVRMRRVLRLASGPWHREENP